MLSQRLKELEAEGIVVRTVIPQTPVRVEYSLTEKGRALGGAIEAVSGWADQWLGGRGRAGEEAARPPALEAGAGLLWVDLFIHSEADAAVLRDVFHFHPLTIEDCLSPHVDPAKIDDHGDYLFIVVQALDEYQPEAEIRSIEVNFYLGPNYVVSSRRDPVSAT